MRRALRPLARNAYSAKQSELNQTTAPVQATHMEDDAAALTLLQDVSNALVSP